MLRILFWIVFAAMTGLRVYFATTTGLSDDEAYYWHWAQFPAWSYFDHPGMVSWVISLSQSALGQNPLAVRLPAILFNTASWWGLVVLGRNMFSPTTGCIVGLLYLLVPIYSLGGIMMVPDSSMAFFWVMVLLLGWKMFSSKKPSPPLKEWILLAVCLGLGVLSKYTMVLVGGTLFLFLLSQPTTRTLVKTPRFWLALAIMILFTLPIFLWNAHYGWPSFYYHFYQRHTGGGGINWQRWLAFWVSQILLLTPAFFAILFYSVIYGTKHFKDIRWRYLLIMSLPPLALFEFQALFAEFKPHWPAPTYLPLLIGAGALWDLSLRRSTQGFRLRTVAVVLFLFFSLPLNALFFSELVYPLVPQLLNHYSPTTKWDPKWDPTNDLYGQVEVQKTLSELQDSLTLDHRQPFLVSHRYQLCAPLNFATRQKVWCLSPQIDQYDFWQTNIASLHGQNAIYISDNRYRTPPEANLDFASCRELPRLNVYRHNILSRTFYFWSCQNFQGHRSLEIPSQRRGKSDKPI